MDLQTDATDSLNEIFEDKELNDEALVMHERCGICMDVVIDRGVLDSCNHWFCFECIDNWATITNLCPLCQNEFQLITCLPVYDTIGSLTSVEQSPFREDEWSVHGNNNTLSFPSYYIDEDAVVCLDGNACKVRNRMSTGADDLNIDTSIACDSCDVWYHAFCVGFNPECAAENSWLCPRCTSGGLMHKSGNFSVDKLGGQADDRNGNLMLSGEVSFSGKVRVSVADAGESALVVSMIEGNPEAEVNSSSLSGVNVNQEGESGNMLSNNTGNAMLDVVLPYKSERSGQSSSSIICSDNVFHTAMLDSRDPFANVFNASSITTVNKDDLDGISSTALLSSQGTVYETEIKQPDNGTQITSVEQSLETGTVFSVLSNQAISGDLRANGKTDDTFEYCDDFMAYSPITSYTPEKNDVKFDNAAVLNHFDALSAASQTVKNGSATDCTLEHDATHLQTRSSSSGEEHTKPWGGSAVHLHETNIPTSNLKDNPEDKYLSDVLDDDLDFQMRKKDLDLDVTMEIHNPVKKAKVKMEPQIIPLRRKVRTSLSDSARREVTKPDIMSIVQENTYRQYHLLGSKDDSTEESEIAPRLRVKKIIRRGDSKEGASTLVQKLREEIRETVKCQSSNVIGKIDFSEELLVAFRTALQKPQGGVLNKLDPSCLRMRKALLQKGKTRENLTKKIYRTSTGKRRRAWDRDWEIEFWKHRCATTKHEKVDTLQSVLKLLRTASSSCNESLEVELGIEEDNKSSILSRVYLADVSVFPRKEDIKPLSAIEGSSPHKDEVDKEISNRVSHSNSNKSASSLIKDPSSAHTRKGFVANGKGAVFSKESSQISKDLPNSDPAHIDKKKWALEVLARKNVMSTDKGTPEDRTLPKGNYPLLAQLPLDMRPVPAPGRNNKVPISVRQPQLYRIAEDYLKRANQSTISRNVHVELAVADAVNVEKDIFERSNSKMVYLNLCSQVISNKTQSTQESAFDITATSEGISCASSGVSSKIEAVNSSDVEEALRLAGLSDTPPGSPCALTRETGRENANQMNSEDERKENVLHDNSHLMIEMHGDVKGDVKVGAAIATDVVNIHKAIESCPKDGSAFLVPNTLKDDKLEILDSLHSSLGRESSLDRSPLNDSGQPSLSECEELCRSDKGPVVILTCDEDVQGPNEIMGTGAGDKSIVEVERMNKCSSTSDPKINRDTKANCSEMRVTVSHESEGGNFPSDNSQTRGNAMNNESFDQINDKCDSAQSISKKVEAYIKEHLRPLCKSGIITVGQYRWAVGKTTEKVMKYHHKAKNANFLIKEGAKVKKLAEDYVEAAAQREHKDS